MTAGSETDSATITILTRGRLNLWNKSRLGTAISVHSNHIARHICFQWACCQQFLARQILPFYMWAWKKITDVACNHVQVWNTYASQPNLQFLSPFSYREIWIDAKTGLPLYSIREGTRAMPSTAAETVYSNYQSVGGVLYPFQVSRSLNGTPWMTISIASVSFNAGLTDSTFSSFQGISMRLLSTVVGLFLFALPRLAFLPSRQPSRSVWDMP